MHKQLLRILLGTAAVMLFATQALAAPPAAPASLTLPPSPDADGTYKLTWAASSTAGSGYVLEEDDNAGFASPATVYSGSNTYLFRYSLVPGSYYYRVRAVNAAAETSAWTNGGAPTAVVVSAAATAAAPPTTVTVPATDADGTYKIFFSGSTTVSPTYVVQQSITGDFSDAVQVAAVTTTYAWIYNRPAGTYYYRVGTTKTGLTPSGFLVAGNPVIVGAQVLTAPGAISTPSPSTTGSYKVIWGASSSGGTYVLEEDDNAGFTSPTTLYTGTGLYKTLSGKAEGTYYYRVKTTKAGLTDSPYASKTIVVQFPIASATCAACHSSTGAAIVNKTQGPAWAASQHANTNANPIAGVCNDCHNEPSTALAEVGCASCHGTLDISGPTHVGISPAVSCIGCHNSHESSSPNIASSWLASKHNAASRTCTMCHDPHSLAPPTDATCTTSCHLAAADNHVTSLPACLECHNPHTLAVDNLNISGIELSPKVAPLHSVTGQIAVTNVVVTNLGDGADADTQEEIQITFNVTLDGAPYTFDGSPAIYRAYEFGSSTTDYASTVYTLNPVNNERLQVNGGAFPTATTLVSAVNGAYTVVVNKTPYTAANATPAAQATFQAGRTYMIAVTDNGLEALPPAHVATAVGYLGSNPRDVADNSACIGCHGLNPFWKEGEHHGANPQGVEACVVCHTVKGSVSRGEGGDRTMAYVHGIHNSHNMPAGGYDRQFPTKDNVIDFEVTYPSYMNNCVVCHKTTPQLAAATSAPMSYATCLSCHDGFNYWYDDFGTHTGVFGGENHMVFNWNTVCSTGTCHPGKTAASFHNGLVTERGGLVYDGVDVSVVEGAKVDMQITGVTRIADAAEVPADADAFDTLSVTWTAAYNGTPVNPCNPTIAVGAPMFAESVANTTTGQVLHNLSILRAYGQGDDWSNPGIGTSPGQPLATNLASSGVPSASTTTGYTACSGNVATSLIKLTATEQATTATKGVIAIQGKVQVQLGYTYDNPLTPAVEVKNVIQVRSKTPTREFVVATGALPGTLRRATVVTDSCELCHVGSLYQHGGNRVDNVEMCVMCHNEASSEQSVRVFDGIDASETYDGKSGMTYGFKSLLHAVHSAGENGAITEVHRTNGNYVWAGHTTVIPHYPTVDVYADGNNGRLNNVGVPPIANNPIDDDPLKTAPVGTGAAALVFGSSAPHGTGPETIPGTQWMVYRAHNLHVPTYPKQLNNCVACHQTGTFGLPDPTKAVATTVDVGTVLGNQGASTGAVYGNQMDDVLQGPAAAACMSCHSSGVPARKAQLTSHANQGGFTPAALTGGRDDVLNGTVVEQCSLCHQ